MAAHIWCNRPAPPVYPPSPPCIHRPPSPPVPCQYNLYLQSDCLGAVGQTIDGVADACWDRNLGADSGVTYNDKYSSVRINGAGCQITLMRECPNYEGANPSLTFKATASDQCFSKSVYSPPGFLGLAVSAYITSQA